MPCHKVHRLLPCIAIAETVNVLAMLSFTKYACSWNRVSCSQGCVGNKNEEYRQGGKSQDLKSGESQVTNPVCNSLHIILIHQIKYNKKDRNCRLSCKMVDFGELQGHLHLQFSL